MVQGSSVVPETSGVTEDQFHAAMCAGLARAEKNHGERQLAYVMELTTTKQLRNIHKGGTPCPKRLWDARSLEPTVLDEIAKAYGVRIVAEEAVCDVDDASVLITRLLLWLHEAQHPDSPGGRKVVHTELLPAEFMIRQLHQATGDWIDQIARARAA